VIHDESLSPTIKDAIIITRALKIQYLWIDSLCIVQDSPDNKKHELPLMASIYKNAFVTIVAASASSASEGFLQVRNPPKVDLVVNYEATYTGGGTLLFRDDFQLTHNHDFPLDPTEARAWCMQESILSARCLVYSSFHLYWCCQTVAYTSQDVLYATHPLPQHIHHYV
jgi:hypothetical protein